MDVFEAIKNRRSIRGFKRDRIKEEDLSRILEAARLAPSAGNCQPLELVVAQELETKELLAEAALGQRFIVEAPVVIVVCANISRISYRYGKRGEQLYSIQDTAAATQNMLLAAHALGYGACWVGAFDENKVAKVIKAPPGIRPLAIVPIGVPVEKPKQPPRLPLSEILHKEKF